MLNQYLGLIPFIIVAFLIVRYWEPVIKLFKKLTTIQVIKVIALYITGIALAAFIIYYAGNWVATSFPNKTAGFLARIGIIIITFFSLFPILQSFIHKATDGIISKDN